MSDEEIVVKLTNDDVSFLRYFIGEYRKHRKKGEVWEANYCASVIALRVEDWLLKIAK